MLSIWWTVLISMVSQLLTLKSMFCSVFTESERNSTKLNLQDKMWNFTEHLLFSKKIF